MRRSLIALVLSTALIGAMATPAGAASTRAEYIAQVDPMCQSFVGPLGDAWAAFRRNDKRTTRAAVKGNLKAFLSGTKREAGSLNQLAGTRTSMIDQIAVVPPPEADVGAVAVWLNHLRQEAAFERSAASAIRKLQVGKFFNRLKQADTAANAGKQAIVGFGFQVCGNFPVV